MPPPRQAIACCAVQEFAKYVPEKLAAFGVLDLLLPAIIGFESNQEVMMDGLGALYHLVKNTGRKAADHSILKAMAVLVGIREPMQKLAAFGLE